MSTRLARLSAISGALGTTDASIHREQRAIVM